MNFIAYADGGHDLFEVSELINVPVRRLHEIAVQLKAVGLITEVE